MASPKVEREKDAPIKYRGPYRQSRMLRFWNILEPRT